MSIGKRKFKCWIVVFIMVWLGLAVKAPAAETMNGAYQMEDAPLLEYETDYLTRLSGNQTVYYKFKALQAEGVSMFAFEASWMSNAATPSMKIEICDNYKRVMESCMIPGLKTGKTPKYQGFSLNRLEPGREYYLKITHTLSSEFYYTTDTDLNLNLYFIPFKAPENVRLSYNKQGRPVIQWSNENAYNIYSSLTSYDSFLVESSVSPEFTDYTSHIVNGAAAAVSFTDENPKSSKMYYRVVGCQYFHDPKDKSNITLMQKRSAVVSTEEIKKGSTYTVNDMKYKVTDDRADGAGTVTLTGTRKHKSDKNFKSLKIGATVKIYGRIYKITAIGNKAFRNYKKLTSITIGNNVEIIGKESFSGCTGVKSVSVGKGTKKIQGKAFYNCKKLQKIKINSKELSSVGSGAIKNIHKKAVIKVPAGKRNYYRGLFGSRTGYKKTMKLNKL